MRRVVLIANPFSTNVSERRLRAVEAALGRAGTVETRLTERRGHATELAAAVDGADALVVFGGDGVANEALNGLRDGVPFGALPGGGTSVFSRALGLPRDPGAAAERIADAIIAGITRRISLGRIEGGRRFLFSAGVGLDAATVRRVDSHGRARDGRRPGDFTFTYEFVRQLAASGFHVEPALEIAGYGRAATALIANCDPYTYAGLLPLHFAPSARFELGLDLVAPVSITPRSMPRLLRYVVRGRGQEDAPDILYAHDLDRLEVTCDRPLPLQLDGEDLGDVEHVVFEAERDAVDVLA
ncbi:MAG: diacylglycerol/lipid kinase family protein [Gaiellaceae bacterium]